MKVEERESQGAVGWEWERREGKMVVDEVRQVGQFCGIEGTSGLHELK